MITQEENEHLAAIKIAYENDSNYYEGSLSGESFKIRMNKDHARNSFRNDDQYVHNLSLVSVNDQSCRVFRKIGNKFQWQIENITDWQDAEEQILEFFYAIAND
ncbi:hypothetical protein [Pedobacter nutrimenti]|uniref:Uncharacterized protein n=1 Tax=Pedobacter nutrimenti TaxID=1241337 RepID=A0A318U6L4_9SPHI|nr:hypothetical protein [Pedobacter nutrimenti]PYF68490.1 hypothetical protein B0O44_11277 [Pedobacter nutrimenti]